jgi:hypothetical protein
MMVLAPAAINEFLAPGWSTPHAPPATRVENDA